MLHVDYVTIEGGSIPELLHAYKLDYVNITRPKPLDVVLVAGYADLSIGYGRDYILWGLQEFAKAVLKKGDEKTENTFAVATLPYHPKHCWLDDDGPVPYRFNNQIDKYDWLNAKIHDLNLENNVPIYPGFHSYGTRKSVRDADGNAQRVPCMGHRWEHWEERARREKFTLRVDRRFKMGKAVNNYFLFRTQH